MTSSLIIYFSRAGENYFGGELKVIEKGNTEVIAEFIQNETGADIFKVEALNEYPQEYMKCTEVSQKEKDENARPELKESLNDISGYDTVFIGFPNWWGTMPMPMWTQLEALDFEGKTVKPFVTHEGSAFGSAEKDLKKICKGAKLKKGLSIQGSNVYESESLVRRWAQD